jgi:HAMP domain-containing protein
VLLSSVFTVWNVLIGVISILLFYLFTRFVIVKPITQLTNVANKLSEGEIDIDLGAAGLKADTKNEISQLALAFERLRKSFDIMYRELASRKQ